MKIELVKQNFDGNQQYKFIPFEFCCEEMKNNPIIDLIHGHAYNSCNDYNIPCVMLRESEIIAEYGEEWLEEKYYKINYCPFCGEAIEVRVAWEEDISNIYFNLCKQRDETWKECNSTDSKSLSLELREKVRELDRQINYLYELAEYKK